MTSVAAAAPYVGRRTADGLALHPLMLLRKPTDEGVAGCGQDRVAGRVQVAGKDRHVAGHHGQVEGLERMR